VLHAIVIVIVIRSRCGWYLWPRCIEELYCRHPFRRPKYEVQLHSWTNRRSVQV